MTPGISVLMPVRNGEAWLGEAIRSVLAQDIEDFELVVVDDGSTDATAPALRDFAAADRRVRVIPQPALGLVAALNRGIAAAGAPYLARLDADDRAKPGRLRKQHAFMQAHPDVCLLGTRAEKIDRVGAVIGLLSPPTDPARLARRLRRSNPFVHSTVMLRTAVVRACGGYRPAFAGAEDYDLWLRMQEAGGIANLPDVLTQYRWHGANVSQREPLRQSFSARLARACAAARRRGAPDPAASLTDPPDWWSEDAAQSFFARDAAFWRFLDASRDEEPDLGAVSRRLFGLDHAERKLAQMRLRDLLRDTKRDPIRNSRARESWARKGSRRAWMLVLCALLHPPRALGWVFGAKQ